jgi:hypothetical protein
MRPAVVGPNEPDGMPFRRLGGARVVDRELLEVVGQALAASSRSLSFACAESRATISVPVRFTRVFTGCFVNTDSVCAMPLSRSTETTSPESCCGSTSGR